MISPIRNCTPPFRLPSGLVYFHDWRYVNHGAPLWRSESNETMPLWTMEKLPADIKFNPGLLPSGVSLKAQQARKTGPFLRPEMIDELFLFGGTVIHEDGLYRLWVESAPVEHIDSKKILRVFDMFAIFFSHKKSY